MRSHASQLLKLYGTSTPVPGGGSSKESSTQTPNCA